MRDQSSFIRRVGMVDYCERIILSDKYAQLHKSAYFTPAMIDER